MKKYATTLILATSLGLASTASADDEKKDRPAPGGDAAAEETARPDRRPGGDRPDADRRRPGGPGEQGRPGGDRPGQQQRFGILEMLREADENDDRKISKEEWTAASMKRAEQMFARLDGDEDGFVTMQDIEKMRERLGGNRPGGDRPPGGPEGRRPRDGGDEKAGGPKRPKRPEVE